MEYDLNDLTPIRDIDALLERLNYFYFIPMVGGIANDGDSFAAFLIYRNREDFLDKMNKLGIVINTLPSDNPLPEPGKSYSGTEMAKFRFPIKDFPDLEEPLHQAISGVKCVVSAYNGCIRFSVCGTGTNDPYSFTMADFNACLRLEEIFDKCGFRNERDLSVEQYKWLRSRKK